MQPPDPDASKPESTLNAAAEANVRADEDHRPGQVARNRPVATEKPSRVLTEGERKTAGVVLIGASVRAAAESAQRGGWSVVGIDRFGDTDTRKACRHFFLWQPPRRSDSDATIAEHCRNLPIVRVGGWTNADETNSSDTRAAGRDPVEAIARGVHCGDCKDPVLLSSIAQAAGVRFPEVILPEANERHPDKNSSIPPARQHTGSWLWKDSTNCGGLGVGWSRQIGTQPMETRQTGDDSSFRQAFIPGQSHGATLFCTSSQIQLLGVCRALKQRIGELPFVYAGSAGPIKIPAQHHRQLIRIAAAYVATATDRDSSFPLLNIDYIVDARQRIWLLEINHRWSASMELIDRVFQWPAGGSLFAAAMQSELPNLETSSEQFIKRIVFARRRIRFDSRRIRRQLKDHESIHDVPARGILIDRGEPVCTLFCRSDDSSGFNASRYRQLVQSIATGQA